MIIENMQFFKSILDKNTMSHYINIKEWEDYNIWNTDVNNTAKSLKTMLDYLKLKNRKDLLLLMFSKKEGEIRGDSLSQYELHRLEKLLEFLQNENRVEKELVKNLSEKLKKSIQDKTLSNKNNSISNMYLCVNALIFSNMERDNILNQNVIFKDEISKIHQSSNVNNLDKNKTEFQMQQIKTYIKRDL